MGVLPPALKSALRSAAGALVLGSFMASVLFGVERRNWTALVVWVCVAVVVLVVAWSLNHRPETAKEDKIPDVIVEGGATTHRVTITPVTKAGREWMADKVDGSAWNVEGDSLYVREGYAPDLMEELRRAGLTIDERLGQTSVTSTGKPGDSG